MQVAHWRHLILVVKNKTVCSSHLQGIQEKTLLFRAMCLKLAPWMHNIVELAVNPRLRV